ncbi:MAG: hypothetical protein UR89_C0029G0003 [Candidatus Roizmanbacteria bacterium GW2011_GWA2_35_8]|uniref:Helix-turn-helix domain-containing protein n=1 Tax=Candidatus Roizmanbacteria bacterium GW2011_GWA2_35_8 TaxID=1618479 RepID=A0A0G0CYW3_9BACT|nr:MAG: hypothetical protein UR89_C0029G0003 [Candidatus Roizmanbacteria bacterium GW2011_GWA2_35_8]
MKKFNGYRPTHRNKWKFIQEGILSVQELSLLEFYADIVDFDRKHPNFGLFEVNFEEISQVFECSTGTVRGWNNKLILIGFIEKTSKRDWYKLICYERYIDPSPR